MSTNRAPERRGKKYEKISKEGKILALAAKKASQWKRTTKKRKAKAQGKGDAWRELDTRQRRGYNEQNEMLERERRASFIVQFLPSFTIYISCQ